MKVLIFPGYGGCIYTDEMKEAAEQQSGALAGRIGRVVDVVESAEVRDTSGDIDGDFKSVLEELKNNYGKIIGLKGLDSNKELIHYYTWSNDIHWAIKLMIVDVDTSKPWKIGEYDGAEYIEYYNIPEIIDEESNYAKW